MNHRGAPRSAETPTTRSFSSDISSTTVLVAGVIGLAARISLIAISPTHNAPWDHHEYVRWGNQTLSTGVLSIYSSPPPEGDAYLPDKGQVTIHHREQYVCNYPPLAAYLFACQARLHRAFDELLERFRSSRSVQVAGSSLGESATKRDDKIELVLVSNTRRARVAYSLAGILSDLLIAMGCLAIVRTLGSARRGQLAFAVAFLLPPLMLDTCFWGQTDSWVLAPAVWMVWAMMRRRWMWAGFCWGTALALKTQGVLLAPIWVFAWLLNIPRGSATGRRRQGLQVVAGVLVGLAWLNTLAIPFWLSSGSAWLHNSFVRNLDDESPHTTLKAFNLWYVDLLVTEEPDSRARLLGLPKDTWGRIMAVVALIAAGCFAWRRSGDDPVRILLFGGLWLLLVVTVATRVHERYLLLCLPFLMCAAFVWRPFWIGFLPLLAVATLQVTVYQWMGFGAGMWPEFQRGAREYHARALRETPAALHDRIPSFDKAMILARDQYDRKRAPDKPWEWILTALFLGGVGTTLWASTARAAPIAAAPEPLPESRQ